MYDRDALLAATDLRRLADELLGVHAGSERAPTWRCPNPQHAQTGRTPPVNVFTTRWGEQRWRCHGCGEGGTAIDLVMVARGENPRCAMAYLASRAGQIEREPDWRPGPERQAETAHRRSVGCRDAAGIQRYVEECADRLWTGDGRGIRRWLTNIRAIPPEVLRSNLIGADLGARRQWRPDGMPRAIGAVLPAVTHGVAEYAQIRVPHPQPDRPRYLNPTADLAPNPRLARVRPTECDHREVIVTEGTIDALSAATAGYRAVAVLSAGYSDESVALALARLPHPLVVAFDADDAGQAGASRLQALLEAQHRPALVLDLGGGDLNDSLRHSSDWPRELPARVDAVSRHHGLGLEVGH